MVAPLVASLGGNSNVLVGPETGDDAGVYLQDGTGLVATVDFIPPVCDDARRYGRVAAANSVSDVYAMGGRPLFALNICCFPCTVPQDVLAAILEGGADVLRETGTALLGGHTVKDDDLKFGLAVVGHADPRRLLTNAGARPGDRLILTKPIGTGVMINAYRGDELDAAGLEPALVEMERINSTASRLALEHGSRAATDITGFGLAGHALAVARASGVGLRLRFATIPVHDAFFDLVARGVTTGATAGNREAAASRFEDRAGLTDGQLEVLFDPQTSGGLLIAVAQESAGALLRALLETGHRAAEIGEVLPGPPRIEAV
jgi:selenide,water dikinase